MQTKDTVFPQIALAARPQELFIATSFYLRYSTFPKMACFSFFQEAEEELAKKEKEVDENIRVQLQLQEDTSATSKDVKERTVALSGAVQARNRFLKVPVFSIHTYACLTHVELSAETCICLLLKLNRGV